MKKFLVVWSGGYDNPQMTVKNDMYDAIATYDYWVKIMSDEEFVEIYVIADELDDGIAGPFDSEGILPYANPIEDTVGI